MQKDYYYILGVRLNASDEEIKRAYRSLSKKWHPDMNPRKDTTAIMQEINEAYFILSDPITRARYDAVCTKNASDVVFRDDVVILAIKKAKESFMIFIRRLFASFIRWVFDVLIDGIKVGTKFILQLSGLAIVILILAALEAPSDNNTIRNNAPTLPTQNTFYISKLADPLYYNEKNDRNPYYIYKYMKWNLRR